MQITKRLAQKQEDLYESSVSVSLPEVLYTPNQKKEENKEDDKRVENQEVDKKEESNKDEKKDEKKVEVDTGVSLSKLFCILLLV